MTMIANLPVVKLPPSGEPQRWSEYLVDRFDGGLATAYARTHLNDTQFAVLVNYYLKDDGTLKARKGFKPLDVSSAKESIIPDSAAPLTFTIVDIAAVKYTIACWDSGAAYETSYWDQSNNRWAGDGGGTSIKTDWTEGYKVGYLRYTINDQEDLILFNGKDAPQRWTGTGASTALGLTVPTLGTPSLTSEATAANKRGNTVTGNYYYKFTAFYDTSSTKYGESGPTAVTGAIASTGTAAIPSQLTLQDCPALPSGATKVNVYRSPPDTVIGPFEYVGHYTSGTSFVDSMPNGEEGAEAPLDAGTPPRLKNAVAFAGRIWSIGLNASGALKNKGVYSNAGSPDMYPAENFFYLPDPIIGPKEFNQNIYWFTEKAIYVIPQGDVGTYSEPLKISETGCDSYDSITDVGNGLCWQFEGNVYWANFNLYNDQIGDYPFPIGNPIADQITNIADTYQSNSVGCHFQGRYYLSFTETGQTVNTKTLVWDVKHGVRMLKQGIFGAWTEVDFQSNYMVNYQNTLWTADNTNKYLMEHETGTVDYHSKTDFDASTSYNIATHLDTGLLHLGHEWDHKLMHSASVWADTTGCTYTLDVDFNDGEFVRIKSYVFAAGTGATTGFLLDTDYLNTGVLGTASGSSHRSDHKKIGSGGKCRNLKVTLYSSNIGTTNLLGFKLFWKNFKDTS